MYIRVDGEVQELTRGMKVDRYKNHNIEVVIDKMKLSGTENETHTLSVWQMTVTQRP